MSVSDRSSGLTPRQMRVVLALMVSDSIASAARAARVSERTIRRWLGTPSFRTALVELQKKAVGDALGRLQGDLPIDRAKILVDPIASRLIDPDQYEVRRAVLAQMPLAAATRFVAAFAMRTRFTEDCLAESFNIGRLPKGSGLFVTSRLSV